MLGHVCDETAGPVTLGTGDDVVAATLDALRDDTETVVLHDSSAADTAEETLLDTLLELDNGHTRRGLYDGVSHCDRWAC